MSKMICPNCHGEDLDFFQGGNKLDYYICNSCVFIFSKKEAEKDEF